ncbi:cell wall-associated NlpC family hydrolase [Mumia flava]|uniref:Cell wall-associated NlpC family hydrolase n=1 Tax=Mumia flava TaxID=1348852 RepID=A0A2M9BJH7_9ACTN|nr:C40 family peptidase [Mumia flava]PJJ58088.1 cell wall-associated NlpC family hydrolase [Mumia flava]
MGTAWRITASRLAAAACGAALCVPTTHAVAAPNDPPGTPSQAEVDQARRNAQAAAGDADAIRDRLDAATSRVETLEADAAAAAEAYNGAMYELRRARSAAAKATADAESAAASVEEQRIALERLVLAGLDGQAPYENLRVVIGGGGPETLLDGISAYSTMTEASEAALARYASARTVARTMQTKADAALVDQRARAAESAQAKRDAAAAVKAAEQAREALAQERDQAMRDVAHAEGISVQLARRRQRALEQLAQEAQAAAASPDLPDPGQATPAQPAPDPGGDAAPLPEPVPAPAADPPKRRKGVEAAIAYAMEQVGEPYVWAGAGPDIWDCSGLTMRAWQAGGRSLPHFSGAQYAVSTPIALSDARRGDLLFWSRGGPSSIYHVALYLGDGWMIEAPRPGKNVQVVPVNAWTLPDLAARV